MPMELARCPECGAQVGGQHHNPVTGVRRAADFEGQFGRPVAATEAGGLAALFGRFGI